MQSLALGLLSAAPLQAASQIPATTRKVTLEKADKGYRWKLAEADVPTIGARQVLVHVRAVALNRGDLEMLEPDEGRDRSGLRSSPLMRPATSPPSASEVTRRPSGRCASPVSIFSNWTDGPASDEKLRSAHGATVDGVLGDYIVLEDTAVAPAALTDSATKKALRFPRPDSRPGWRRRDNAQIHKGDVVLVQGTGGVSIFALQFAAASGARVIVTSSSDDKLRRALGARRPRRRQLQDDAGLERARS